MLKEGRVILGNMPSVSTQILSGFHPQVSQHFSMSLKTQIYCFSVLTGCQPKIVRDGKPLW